MKKILLTLLVALAVVQVTNAQPRPGKNVSNEVILHAWCWSFNTIRENLKDIAEAGYTIVQTSPAQHCVTEVSRDKGGGNQLYGKGRWYYVYQPTDWKIGNYQMGTKADLIALCNEAKKYGITIIVDVLPNHTSINDLQVEDALDNAVGGHDNLYHANGFNEIKDYNDRGQCTTGQMGGLPDVNTENPDFQYYYMQYVNELLACGVRGFRYDTAKHIGLPGDPLDPKAKENDFWEVAMGRKSVKGLRMSIPRDSLYIYGEVLQDRNVREADYANTIGAVPASSMGWVLRNALEKYTWDREGIASFNHTARPDQLITWVESHDTYCNEHESAHLTDDQIRMGWVFITARQYGDPLFFSRPDGSSPTNIWGNNIVGKKGNDAFKHPEVVAVNKFRKLMKGEAEKIVYTKEGKVVMVERGRRGAALINVSNESIPMLMRTNLPNGTYTDKVSGSKFVVKGNMLKGVLAPYTSYILIKK